jgi:hypothetical protein
MRHEPGGRRDAIGVVTETAGTAVKIEGRGIGILIDTDMTEVADTVVQKHEYGTDADPIQETVFHPGEFTGDLGC